MRIFVAFIFITFSIICYGQEGAASIMLREGKSVYIPELDPSLWRRDIPDSLFIDSIAIIKEQRIMYTFNNNKIVKLYKIHLGKNPIGPKHENGDYKTPEGLYKINAKNVVSMFHKSLGISYPNEKDLEEAKKQGKSAGGDIVLHGWPNGTEHLGKNRYHNDWTWGCIALTNEEIDELFEHVQLGTPILILP